MSTAAPQPLQRVWDSIPSTGCKGLCAESCGPVDGTPMERALLAARGVPLPDLADSLLSVLSGAEPAACPALIDGRCSVYDVRPTVCRLWGAVEDMPCPWGCAPDGGLLTREEGRRVMRRAEDAGHLESRAVRRARAKR